MELLLTNIGKLVGITTASKLPKRGSELAEVGSLEHAYIHIKDGRIEQFGSMKDCPELQIDQHDCKEALVSPGYIDSHTHFVFAQSRSQEFKMRLEGKSYQEIAASGGGILNSAARMSELDENSLYELSMHRIHEAVKGGTTAFEIKSGYGLNTETELKMLRVIKRIKQNSGLPIKATFLGAHALPAEFKNNKQGYMNEVCNIMLPQIAQDKLADYIDIFCEEGYFDLIDLSKIIEAGQNHGLRAKVHVNQFNSFGAVPLAVKLGALSVDHLEVMTETDIRALSTSNTIGVGLPLCSLFLNIPYAPMRKLIDAGAIVALASDFNPGSSPSYNLNLAFSLACTQMKMLPNEAFNALTYNAAFALQLQDEVGSIQVGKRANFIIFNPQLKELEDIAYWFGENPVQDIVIS